MSKSWFENTTSEMNFATKYLWCAMTLTMISEIGGTNVWTWFWLEKIICGRLDVGIFITPLPLFSYVALCYQKFVRRILIILVLQVLFTQRTPSGFAPSHHTLNYWFLNILTRHHRSKAVFQEWPGLPNMKWQQETATEFVEWIIRLL